MEQAWAEADAAMRDRDDGDWMMELVFRDAIDGAVNSHTGIRLDGAYPFHFEASAGRAWTTDYYSGFGPTPITALQALTEKLREAPR